MIIEEDEYIAHYGIKRKSGRYPWGSGETPYQRSLDFQSYIQKLKDEGLSDVEIARGINVAVNDIRAPFTTTDLRATKAISKAEIKREQVISAQKLKDKGWSNTAIAKHMGTNESNIRNWLQPGADYKQEQLDTVCDALKKSIAITGTLDVSKGVEHHLGVSRTTLDTAIAMLKSEGYEEIMVQVPQLGTKDKTTTKTLSVEGTKYRDISSDLSKIGTVVSFSEDNGRTMLNIHEPMSIDSKRISVKYGNEGGKEADGVIYVRPGVEDISLGGSRYAQVRIMVDGTHYLKGMAIYKDDLPKGVDLQFNTDKDPTGNKLDAMKKLHDDPDNPFKSTVRQIIRKNADGTETLTSAMNILGSKETSGIEGGWEEWSNTLASQMLSKQSTDLAKTQLEVAYSRRAAELETILALNNPVVKKQLLGSFADSADSAAVSLKAAAMPRQATKVILPISSLKDNEIYAPTFKHGEEVVLIRYPHGGIFEIPNLVVTHTNKDGKKLLGNSIDAVGINANVAQKLSGADFDGDTVVVIPNNQGAIKTAPILNGLKTFDPHRQYAGYPGMRTMTNKETQIQMGMVSNLITDMTLRGAPTDELVRAVRHSMVVIDAEKHKLDWKRSEEENSIKELRKRYQGKSQGGASTIISRAKKKVDTDIPAKLRGYSEEGGPIDLETGKKNYREPETYVSKDGITITKTRKEHMMNLTDDARSLMSSSPTVMETIYADHANKLKVLANQARKEYINSPSLKQSPSAKQVYSSEAASLKAKLKLTERHAPLERAAQVIANETARLKIADTPGLTSDEIKKIKHQALARARGRLFPDGAPRIDITPREWEAIQAGAISNHMLEDILKKADLDQVKKLATPQQSKVSSSMIARARSMLKLGYSWDEISDALGVSVSALSKNM